MSSPDTSASAEKLAEKLRSSVRPQRSLSSLWTDGVGTVGTRAVQILVIGLLAALLIIGLGNITLVVIPLLLAIILACALWPLVRLTRKVMSPILATWAVFIGALLVLGGIGTALYVSVQSQFGELQDQAVEGFNRATDFVHEVVGSSGPLAGLDINLQEIPVDDILESSKAFVTSSAFSAGAISTISAAGHFVTGAVLLMVMLFFFLKDGDRIWAFFVSFSPIHMREKFIVSGDRALRTFGGYIRGTAIIAAVDAIGITLALLILQVPLAIPLGVIVFFGSFIPMVGATIAGVLATLVALVANGPIVALLVLAAVIAVNQLEGNFLQPVVMSQTLNLHALVILMALTGGTVLAGLIGAILSVPLIAAAWAVIRVWTGRDGAYNSMKVGTALDDIKAIRVLADEQARVQKAREKAKRRLKRRKKHRRNDATKQTSEA